MCNGWVKIHRKMVDWEWYSDTNTFRLFFHLLLTANSEDKRWQGIVVKRGQVVISYDTIKKRLGLSLQQARTAMSKLISTNEITKQVTSRYTIVTISKYEEYQQNPKAEQQAKDQAEQQASNKQATSQATSKQQHLKKNKKKEDKEEDSLLLPIGRNSEPKKSVALATPHSQALLEKRLKDFYDSLVPYVQFYGKDFIREFYDYWSEPNKSRTKFRMELERTWSLERRLATWAKRGSEYARRTNQTSNGSKPTKAERDAEFLRHVQEELAKPDEEPTILPWEV